jgi:hypothetical protein
VMPGVAHRQHKGLDDRADPPPAHAPPRAAGAALQVTAASIPLCCG